MKVNKVFCYSKEVANKNGNKFSIGASIFYLLLMSLIISIICALTGDYDQGYILMAVITIGLITAVFSSIYYVIVKIGPTASGYAITEDNRIFKLTIFNSKVGFHYPTMMSSNNLASKGIGTAGGLVVMSNEIKRTQELMTNEEFIAKTIEENRNVTNANIREILKVYSINEKKRFINITCDYRLKRNNKIYYKKNLKLDKSYNELNDLVSALKTHIN